MVSNGTGFVALKADLGVFTEAARQHCRMTSASPSASAVSFVAVLRRTPSFAWAQRRFGAGGETAYHARRSCPNGCWLFQGALDESGCDRTTP
jgi:hypothetical protein